MSAPRKRKFFAFLLKAFIFDSNISFISFKMISKWAHVQRNWIGKMAQACQEANMKESQENYLPYFFFIFTSRNEVPGDSSTKSSSNNST